MTNFCGERRKKPIRGEEEDMNDLTVVAISLSVILLCWAVVKVNHRIEQALRNPKQVNKLDQATDSQQ